jgi:hypothetical protein
MCVFQSRLARAVKVLAWHLRDVGRRSRYLTIVPGHRIDIPTEDVDHTVGHSYSFQANLQP